jgi:DNA polymerase
MGGTAARSVLGRDCSILRERGRIQSCRYGSTLLTVHPSFLLRMPDEVRQRQEYGLFVKDLRLAGAVLHAKSA